jgi:hypothetical protein
MRTSAIMLAVLAVAISKSASGGPLSTYTLIGTPVTPPSTSTPAAPKLLLQVSLNPDPAPPLPNPDSYLSLIKPTMPVYGYPYDPSYFEIDDFSFDIEQVLSIGSSSGGASEGKVTFNPFHITSASDGTVHGFFQSIDATGHVLDTFEIEIAGIGIGSLRVTTPSPLPCLPCAEMTLGFIGVGADPVVSFSVFAGTTDYAFAAIPEPSSVSLFGVGLAGIALARRKRGAFLPPIA